ncbi:hypothetical protein HOL21_03970 [Candidatus Woesearchaeota archaeon]|jgi:hypothetical protein|nr:hypothetical protein [Candidatus Woesearchaeota archaeon]MBT5397343.1 hypothetical protein [Candidatus Woesearchaeota archaeon]MBT5924397.1 hypothetical protein [Candidatus Woesearchaeota archaeon]MBT6367812.1 hypothetical protein [Candidatus Woesearchaeota archaeon]MBT7762743.1 hypothetical protein [Candidatus Woesearchaeota archaeon]
MEHITNQLKGDKCYCGHLIEKNDWTSEWCEHAERHYKNALCSKCGKKNLIKLDFDGSGHDDAVECKCDSIDSIVKKVQEF